MPSTPYPTFQQPLSPWQSPSDQPPTGAQTWSYGQYIPAGTPAWPPPQQQQPLSWGGTPASPWGPTTPAGTWGAQSSAPSYGPTTPSGYPGFAGYGPQPQTPYFPPNPPGTPYDSSSWQPVTPGWYEAEQKKKRKKTNSFGKHTWGDQTLQRSHSLGAHPSLQRSASWGYPSAYDHRTPAYSREPYNSLNLARRPRDWRADYTPRDGIAALAAYFPRVGRSRSDVRGLLFTLFPFLPTADRPTTQNYPIQFAETSTHCSHGNPNLLRFTTTSGRIHSCPIILSFSTSTDGTILSTSPSSSFNLLHHFCGFRTRGCRGTSTSTKSNPTGSPSTTSSNRCTSSCMRKSKTSIFTTRP